MEKVISAGIIIFRRTPAGPKFLLLYRGRGTWDYPRGRMEGEERSWQTALREVREETGLRAGDLKWQSNFKVYEKFPYTKKGTGEKVFKIIIFYLAETEKPKIVISWEHEGYGWFSFNEAQKLLSKFKNRVEILKKVRERIGELSRTGITGGAADTGRSNPDLPAGG